MVVTFYTKKWSLEVKICIYTYRSRLWRLHNLPLDDISIGLFGLYVADRMVKTNHAQRMSNFLALPRTVAERPVLCPTADDPIPMQSH